MTVAVAVGCVALSLAVAAFTGPSDSATHLIAVLAVSVVGLAWAAIGAWRHRHVLGLVGALLVGAQASWLVGALGWDLNVLVLHRTPFPSWTDAFFLLSYPVLIGAAILMVRRRETRRDVAALIDAVILTVGVGVVAYAFVVVDAAAAENGGWLGRTVAVAYPLCDVLVAGVLVRMLLSAAARSRAGLWLVCSVGCLLLADVGFMLAYFAGVAEAYDGWLDAPYMLFFLLVGLSLQQRDVASLVRRSDDSPDERLGPLRMVALGIGLLLAPLTLLVGSVANEPTKVRGAAIGAGVMFLLAMARMGQLIRAVERNSDLLLVQARTDALTGLPNRRTFDFELERTLLAAGDYGNVGPVSVAMLDLDRFKAYNDAFGHGAGDLLLQRAATAWRVALLSLSPVATLARYGGEEFGIVLPGLDEHAAAAVLRHLLPLTPEAQTFSAGVAQRRPDESAAGVLVRADLRLYEAKALGRARVVGAPPPTATAEPGADRGQLLSAG